MKVRSAELNSTFSKSKFLIALLCKYKIMEKILKNSCTYVLKGTYLRKNLTGKPVMKGVKEHVQ
jgi:hypothetical protein